MSLFFSNYDNSKNYENMKLFSKQALSIIFQSDRYELKYPCQTWFLNISEAAKMICVHV